MLLQEGGCGYSAIGSPVGLWPLACAMTVTPSDRMKWGPDGMAYLYAGLLQGQWHVRQTHNHPLPRPSSSPRDLHTSGEIFMPLEKCCKKSIYLDNSHHFFDTRGLIIIAHGIIGFIRLPAVHHYQKLLTMMTVMILPSVLYYHIAITVMIGVIKYTWHICSKRNITYCTCKACNKMFVIKHKAG